MSLFEDLKMYGTGDEKTIKKCPKCGTSFPCEGDDCWCHNYQILNKNMHYIRTIWNDCLCPACLKEFAENKEQLP